MTTNAILQLVLYVVVLVALVKPLGSFMARVYEGKPCGLDKIFGPLERLIYRMCGVDATARCRGTLHVRGPHGQFPGADHRLRPAAAPVLPAIESARHGRHHARPGVQHQRQLRDEHELAKLRRRSDAQLPVANAGARRPELPVGRFRHGRPGGNDPRFLPPAIIVHRQFLVRLYAQHGLHPAALVDRRGLGSRFAGGRADVQPVRQGCALQPTTFQEPVLGEDGSPVLDDKGQPTTKTSPLDEQTIAVGPAASQIAIKQLGTNGGGFYNVNSSHPLENPTPLANFFELLSILVISAALCYTFGIMIHDTRQGWAILVAMLVIFLPLLSLCYWCEQGGNPHLAAMGVDDHAGPRRRAGTWKARKSASALLSALWATATTSASNGSVNSMHDSYTPLGGLVPMWLMQLGEVVFGGVGSGLYGMLAFAIIAVFIGGLMVGRTPEYLGKKIEAFEMKMAAIIILVPPMAVLVTTAIAVSFPDVIKPSIPTRGRTASARCYTPFRRPATTTAAPLRGSMPTSRFSTLCSVWPCSRAATC